jgi:hypothetical protein
MKMSSPSWNSDSLPVRILFNSKRSYVSLLGKSMFDHCIAIDPLANCMSLIVVATISTCSKISFVFAENHTITRSCTAAS